MITALANHLWQSTFFAAAAALLALVLRGSRAEVRCWIWRAASLKFLIPFSALSALGHRIDWRTIAAATTAAPASIAQTVERATRPIASPFDLSLASYSLDLPRHPGSTQWPEIFALIWVCGAFVVLFRWWKQWRALRQFLRTATRLGHESGLPVLSSPALVEPGVFGIFRPVLLLPEGIGDRLTPPQLKAVIAHERSHVRRRDNLWAAVHMTVEAIFWFHPLLWWIGHRLIEERELACDEEVLLSGAEPRAYATGIVEVCKSYLESPLPCAAGVTGADLKKRVVGILNHRLAQPLSPARKSLLAAACALAIASPIAIGLLRGQAATETFEVASVKPADPAATGAALNMLPGGGLRASNVTLQMLITFAYRIQAYQLSGGPSWVGSERFEILGKPAASPNAKPLNALSDSEREQVLDLIRARTRALLSERFQFVVRHESREVSGFVLVIDKAGIKFKETTFPPDYQRIGGPPGDLNVEGVGMKTVATVMSQITGRPVEDKTGLTAKYDFHLKFVPATNATPPSPDGTDSAAPDPEGPSIFTALREQAGLKLEVTKTTIDHLVIERVEKPAAN